jgi:hypothetical protein
MMDQAGSLQNSLGTVAEKGEGKGERIAHGLTDWELGIRF